MSHRAIVWAIHEAPIDTAGPLWTLVVMAEEARPDGSGVCLSIGHLARLTRRSVSTIYRNLRALERAGLIRRSALQTAGARRRANMPVVYDLALEKRRTREVPAWCGECDEYSRLRIYGGEGVEWSGPCAVCSPAGLLAHGA